MNTTSNVFESSLVSSPGLHETSLTVEFKGNNGRFASLQSGEVLNRLTTKFGDMYSVSPWSKGMDHTKAAQKVGGGHQYSITMRSNVPSTLRSGDVVYPQIVLRDRTYPGAALTVEFGLYRLVCSNGLMAFRSVATPIRVPHFKNRQDTLMYLDRVIEASADKFIQVILQANILSTVRVNNPLHVITQLDIPPTVIKEITDRINAGLVRPEDDISTVWGVYNLVNEIDRQKARRNSQAYQERDTGLLDTILKLAA